jgi:hypothetical protein
MKSSASGRSALILTSGLLLCLVGPSHAATDGTTDDPASKASSRVVAHHSRHKSAKPALKSSNGNQDARTKTAVDSGAGAPTIPPFVADANAQLPPPEEPTIAAEGMRARADDLVQNSPNSADSPPAAEEQVVPPDQLNDMDRTVREEVPDTPAAPSVAMASAEAAADADAPEVGSPARDNESSLWDHTSLIGKIFIGFGALLTVASAGRMFMA